MSATMFEITNCIAGNFRTFHVLKFKNGMVNFAVYADNGFSQILVEKEHVNALIRFLKQKGELDFKPTKKTKSKRR